MPDIAGVDSAYRHYGKEARFRGHEDAGGLRLKWYDLAAPGRTVPEAKHADARRAVADGRLAGASEFGFAMVHRCGEDFYFLLLTIWRGSNEAWEAVYYSDPGQPTFAPFAPAYPALGTFRPTYCVWELAIAGFEAAAWTRFLSSPRAAADVETWTASAFDGPV